MLCFINIQFSGHYKIIYIKCYLSLRYLKVYDYILCLPSALILPFYSECQLLGNVKATRKNKAIDVKKILCTKLYP